jgi:hypothetical protein
MVALGIWFLLAAGYAFGYEYHLAGQLPRKTAITLGEQFNTDPTTGAVTVSGAVYYYYQKCAAGTCGKKVFYCGRGTWNMQGNLLSSDLLGDGTYSTTTHDYPFLNPSGTNTAPCPFPAPTGQTGSSTTPLARTNNEIIYASQGSATTGKDVSGVGYLDLPASHFTWSYANCPYYFGGCYGYPSYGTPYTIQPVLTSDGDLSLDINSTVSQVTVSGSYTNGTGKVTSVTGDCLSSPLSPGSSCTLTVTFDSTTIVCTTSPYGYGYNVLDLSLMSDAGALPAWEVHFTISSVPSCSE